MQTTTPSDRAAGCIMGAFIGDALGLGPHWYYDLSELRAKYGPWITDYTDPQPGHYHEGMRAGESSQTGLIMQMLLESLAAHGAYDEADFTRKLDEGLLPLMTENPRKAPGGYSNHSIRQVRSSRLKGKPWGQTAGHADTSEGAERAALVAAIYAPSPREVAVQTARCCRLAQDDSLVVQQSAAFALVAAALIRGEAFDDQLTDKIMDGLRDEGVSFVSESSIASSGASDPSLGFASPDALLLPSWIAEAARDPGIVIEPAWKVSLLYGMSCAVNFVLPASYYLAVRFSRDFEAAVLHALNGGGQNMSRACLTGALVGAQVGLSGIPARFIDGLKDGAHLKTLAVKIGGRLG